MEKLEYKVKTDQGVITYTPKDIPPRMARDALYAQDASNLGAVGRSFGEHLARLQQFARENGHGTEWINRHPCVVLFTTQFLHLSIRSILPTVSATSSVRR